MDGNSSERYFKYLPGAWIIQTVRVKSIRGTVMYPRRVLFIHWSKVKDVDYCVIARLNWLPDS